MREDADLRQKDISDYLHCSQQIYSHYETGKVELPLAFLVELAKYYDTTTDYILGLTNNKKETMRLWIMISYNLSLDKQHPVPYIT